MKVGKLEELKSLGKIKRSTLKDRKKRVIKNEKKRVETKKINTGQENQKQKKKRTKTVAPPKAIGRRIVFTMNTMKPSVPTV